MKTTKEKIEVMQHWADGGDIECCLKSYEGWITVPNTGIDPSWNWEYLDYRIKEKEVPAGPIPWDCVNEKYNYAAMDENGSWWIYASKPCIDNDDCCWYIDDLYHPGRHITNIFKLPTNINWKESLYKRPNHQEK